MGLPAYEKSSYIGLVTRRALKMVREQAESDEERILAQVKMCNEMIAALSLPKAYRAESSNW